MDKRADFSVLPMEWIKQVSNKAKNSIHVCDNKPYLTLNFYSYIHKKYAWAIPAIEKSYRNVFLP